MSKDEAQSDVAYMAPIDFSSISGLAEATVDISAWLSGERAEVIAADDALDVQAEIEDVLAELGLTRNDRGVSEAISNSGAGAARNRGELRAALFNELGVVALEKASHRQEENDWHKEELAKHQRNLDALYDGLFDEDTPEGREKRQRLDLATRDAIYNEDPVAAAQSRDTAVGMVRDATYDNAVARGAGHDEAEAEADAAADKADGLIVSSRQAAGLAPIAEAQSVGLFAESPAPTVEHGPLEIDNAGTQVAELDVDMGGFGSATLTSEEAEMTVADNQTPSTPAPENNVAGIQVAELDVDMGGFGAFSPDAPVQPIPAASAVRSA